MAAVRVDLSGLGSYWSNPCQQALTDLNALFKKNGVNVVLATSGAGTTITVKTDASIQGNAVHGRTTAWSTDAGNILRAEVCLPPKVQINTPSGLRDAGPGILEVIAAHEFVHALGHGNHNTHLMGQTMSKEMGDTPSRDKLKTIGVIMPPLALSTDSIAQLKAIWN